MTQEHTPTPWKIINRPESGQPIRIGRGKNLNDIAVVYDAPPQTGQSMANAEFIVRACNAHDDLFGALSDVVDDIQKGRTEWETNGTLAYAKVALAKAKAVQ